MRLVDEEEPEAPPRPRLPRVMRLSLLLQLIPGTTSSKLPKKVFHESMEDSEDEEASSLLLAVSQSIMGKAALRVLTSDSKWKEHSLLDICFMLVSIELRLETLPRRTLLSCCSKACVAEAALENELLLVAIAEEAMFGFVDGCCVRGVLGRVVG